MSQDFEYREPDALEFALFDYLYAELHKRTLAQNMAQHNSGIQDQESRHIPDVTGGWFTLFLAWGDRRVSNSVALELLQKESITVEEADAAIDRCV